MSFFDPFMVGRSLDPPPTFYKGLIVKVSLKTRAVGTTMKKRKIEVEMR